MERANGSFSRRVRAFAADVPEVANDVKKAFAKEFLTVVVPATPVKSGKARSNWNVGIGGPNFVTRPTEGRSGDRALQRGVQVIRRVRPGEAIHISNGLPYIVRLNQGWSAQAPAGYIERAYAGARALIARVRFGAERKASK